MAIADVLALPGFASRVGGASSRGRSGQELVDWAAQHFPQANRRDLAGAVGRVERAGRAGRELAGAAADETIARADIPVNPLIGAQYLYGVEMEWTDPNDGRRRHRYLTIERGAQVTKGDLASLAEEQLAAQDRETDTEGRVMDLGAVTLFTARVVSIYRRS